MVETFEKEELSNSTWVCQGVRPRKTQPNGRTGARVLVTPSTFNAEELCNCSNPDMKVPHNQECCACQKGKAPLEVNAGEDTKQIKCFSCFGPGCQAELCHSANAQRVCSEGYEGTLCASCESDWRSVSFAHCTKCREQDKADRRMAFSSALLGAFTVLAILLWFYILKPQPDETPTEQGFRLVELLEQLLLILGFLQLLYVILSVVKRKSKLVTLAKEGGNEEEDETHQAIRNIVSLDFGWILDLLSVQCLLGFKDGRNLEVLVSAFALPSLCIIALILGFVSKKRSPFYGLKFAIVAMSMMFQGTVQVTLANLTWCQVRSRLGLSLQDHEFLIQRPFVTCKDSMSSNDPIGLAMRVAFATNVVLIPGCLFLLGWYITRKMRGVQSLASSIAPLLQCDNSDDHITMQFATVQIAAEKILLTKDSIVTCSSVFRLVDLFVMLGIKALFSEPRFECFPYQCWAD